jgi:hypothetical protein
VKITVGDFTLYDDADGRWTLSDISGSIARLLQEIAPIRAAAVKIKPRGMKRTDFSFTVSRPHDDEADTFAELLAHETQIPLRGVIAIEVRRSDGGSRTYYIDGCVESVVFRPQGRRTFHTYKIIGGAVNADRPLSET